MKIRLANVNDIEKIIKVIDDAKLYLRSQNSLQWNLPDGYPNKETMLNDINNQNCYILENNEAIIGTMTIIIGDDENYYEIDGKWLTSRPYAQIHRIAIKNEYHHQKLGVYMLMQAEKIIKEKAISSIKIDTHKANIPMIKTLEELGYTYCGEIVLKRTKEDNLRNAYEKEI